MKLADRLSRISESATLSVMREAKRLAAEGKDIVDLGPGEPDFDSPDAVKEAGIAAIRGNHTRYTDVAGIPALRAAIAEYFHRRDGVAASAAEVMVTAGAKQSLYNAALALFGPGDEVLIPSPCWVSFPDQVLLAGAEPKLLPCVFEDGFKVRGAAVAAAWGEKTRGIVLNSPCNPTGAVLEVSDLDLIVETAAANRGVVVFDETYEHFVYDGARHVSAAAWRDRYPETVVTVGSFSKTFAMTGWRVGYLLGSREVIQAGCKLQGHMTSNATSVAQHAALAAFSSSLERREMLAEYGRRRAWIVAALSAIPGFECPPPEGAFYVLVRITDFLQASGISSSAALAEILLREASVATVPGEAFGAPGFLRLSYAVRQDRLEEGVGRIAHLVEGLVAAPPGPLGV